MKRLIGFGVLTVAVFAAKGAFACDCSLPINYGNKECAAAITAALDAKPSTTLTSGSTSNANSSAAAAANASSASRATAAGGSANASGGNATAAGGSVGAVTASGGNQAQKQTATGGNASNAGVTQGVTIEDNSRAARIPVATAYAASLTSGMDTCLGSASGGAQTGLLGLSLGGTRRDKNCEMIKKAHLIAQYSMLASCAYIYSHDADIKAAFDSVNLTCDVAVAPPAPPVAVVTGPAYTSAQVSAIVRKAVSK